MDERLKDFQVTAQRHFLTKFCSVCKLLHFLLIASEANVIQNLEAEHQQSLFDELSSSGRFRFWLNLSEYFHQKGFIPLLRAPSFF